MSASMNAATALAEPTAPAAEGEAAKKIEGRSPWRLGYERLRRDRAAMISVAVIILIILVAIFAPVIAAIMIRWMFNDQFGVVNAALEGLGLAPISWLTQRWTTFAVILLTDVWLWTPWFALILLAGLQSLPPEPFEAARIDAASAWRTFRYITLPMLRPVMVVCIVIRAIDAFRTFDIVWTISGGGPARATELFSLYAYVEAFQFLNLARGSAAAVIGAIIIVVFAMLLYRVLNRFVEVSK